MLLSRVKLEIFVNFSLQLLIKIMI